MEKPFLTYEQQILLLKSKGLSIPDEALAKDALLRIGYFSLIGGYKQPFKNPTTKRYRDGASLADILALYQFDAELRDIILVRLLIVERAMKTQIAYAFCNANGSEQTSYLSPGNYTANPKLRNEVTKLIGVLERLACGPTDYPYINHCRIAHANVPLWVLINAVTFGSLSKMFALLPQTLQSQICKRYPLNAKQMERMLSVLTKYRNVCAHGERLFSHTTRDDIPDLPLHEKLRIPKKGNQYISGKRDLFAVLIALRYLLPSAEFRAMKNALSGRIRRLLSVCDKIDEPTLLAWMGFPQNWGKITSLKLPQNHHAH